MKEIKILQINIWGGRIKDGLTSFLSKNDYDIVCMQEAVWSETSDDFLRLFIDTIDKIKEEAGYPYNFRSSHCGIKLFDGKSQLEQGNVILSKIPFKKTEEKTVFGQYYVADNSKNPVEAINRHRYTAQKVELENGLILVNYHGYWLPNPIGDETTIDCMKSVANMVKNEKNPVVLCGDLNVSAKSPAMRELDFLNDLTSLNKVKTTLRNIRFKKDVACDHILISKNLKYKDFTVINKPISDHRALSAKIIIP